MSSCTTRAGPFDFAPRYLSPSDASVFWTVTDQDVSGTQWVSCIIESQMPSVPLRALLVYDQSPLRVCAAGRTLCNNIIGVTDIACGHDQAPFRSR